MKLQISQLRRAPIVFSRERGADVVGGPLVPGTLKALITYRQSFTVAIFSSRLWQPGGMDAVKAWLLEHLVDSGLEVPGDSYSNFAENVLTWPEEKSPALVTINDRAITVDGTWPTTKTLQAFKPLNKR